ncbi:hypothetical protein MTR67_052179 [Solanum verrucosum]|uniref:Uncharacterized protein n=1 Tax=Solanum verrucosum TaxID=315347 RepID=A0AAF0V7J0_SOLVR|nr:hypothetical protein MTR67_052179 [Solanum verrucosum]
MSEDFNKYLGLSSKEIRYKVLIHITDILYSMGRDINEFELISGTVKPSATAKEAKDVTYILKYDWSHFLCRRLPRDASYKLSHQVLPDPFHIVCISEDGLKEFITWKLETLVSIAR